MTITILFLLILGWGCTLSLRSMEPMKDNSEEVQFFNTCRCILIVITILACGYYESTCNRMGNMCILLFIASLVDVKQTVKLYQTSGETVDYLRYRNIFYLTHSCGEPNFYTYNAYMRPLARSEETTYTVKGIKSTLTLSYFYLSQVNCLPVLNQDVEYAVE